MARIELTDTLTDVIVKMAEGNPGAATAMMEIYTKGEKIDPEAAMGGFGAILLLDTFGIYGTEIYIIWSDKCKRDTRLMLMLMLMRAVQLGLMPESKLKTMAEDQMRQVDLTAEEWDDYDQQVCAKLKQFARPAVDATAV